VARTLAVSTLKKQHRRARAAAAGLPAYQGGGPINTTDPDYQYLATDPQLKLQVDRNPGMWQQLRPAIRARRPASLGEAAEDQPPQNFQYGGYQYPQLPPMPQMPDLTRQLANLRQAGLIGQDQTSPLDVLNELKAFGADTTTTKPTRTLEQALTYNHGVDAAAAERQIGLQNGLPSRPQDTTNLMDPYNLFNPPEFTIMDPVAASRRGGRFRDAGEYTPAKKAKGGILIRRPPAAAIAKPLEVGSDGGGHESPSPGRHHLPIPVFSTTIILAHKKPGKKRAKDKEEKMARGGKVRGAGIAKRGMRFSGIF
jgi:hypothetical protein